VRGSQEEGTPDGEDDAEEPPDPGEDEEMGAMRQASR